MRDGAGSELEKAEEGKLREPKTKPFEREVFLINVNSVVKLAYITSMLDEKDIGYRVSGVSSGSYLTVLHGKSFFGKNIYVGQSNQDEAMWAIESYDADIEMEAELDILKEQMISTGGKMAFASSVIMIFILVLMFLMGAF